MVKHPFDEEYFMKGTKSNYGGKYAPYIREVFLPMAMKRAIYIEERYDPKSVLDLGCGKGFLVLSLRGLGINARGIDISEWAIDNCEKKISKFVKIGDIRKLSKIKKNSVDLLVCDDTLEHLPIEDIDKTIKGMCRVAKNNIVVTVVVKDNGKDKTHQCIMSLSEWVELFTKYGFKPVHQDTVTQVDGNVISHLDLEVRETDYTVDPNYIIMTPVWNVEKTLPIFLDHIDRLDPPPMKILFCENNSTDKTVDIINNYKGNKELIQFSLDKNMFKEKTTHRHTGIALARQKLLDRAREIDPDYALFIDADVLPLNTDLIRKVHLREFPILGAPYYRHFPEGIHLCSLWSGNKPGTFALRQNSVVDLDTPLVTSGGAMFLSRKIIQDKKLHFSPIYLGGGELTAEDFGFCFLARSMGYQIYLDFTIKVHHLIYESVRPKPWAVDDSGKFIDFTY